MPLISVTRLRVRSYRFMPGFFYYAMRSARQAQDAKGNLGVNLTRDTHLTFWTGTVWEDEEAMRAFVLAGPHRKVMNRLPEWCDEAHVVHWTQKDAKLPEWYEAHRRLVAHGRALRVYHPSINHENRDLPPPLLK